MDIEEIDDRFKSGNSVPVERASLRAGEWVTIYALLKAVAYPDLMRIESELGELHRAGMVKRAEEASQLAGFALGLPLDET